MVLMDILSPCDHATITIMPIIEQVTAHAVLHLVTARTSETHTVKIC